MVTETIKDMWHNIRHEHAHISQTFDGDNSFQHKAIKQSIDSLASDPPHLFKKTLRIIVTQNASLVRMHCYLTLSLI